MQVKLLARLLVVPTLASAAVLAVPAAAHADGPGVGSPTIVSLGDSYISGEAGRWAGNTNRSSSRIDALGPYAYADNSAGTAESIPGCHRSSSAEVFVGGVTGINLACSGAETRTDASGTNFKPGLDFYADAAGRVGQARALQSVAATHNVRMVVVSIGGNDFGFASTVQSCVTDFLLSSSWWPNYCNNDRSVAATMTSSNVAARTADIRAALLNVRQAMQNSGYADSAYTILVQTYPSPIPGGSGFRYSQSGYSRQSVGGCGFWNRDADWANRTALTTINSAVRAGVNATGLGNTKVLDLSAAYNGRRLCENTVGLLEEKGLSSWSSAGAVDRTEWVNQIRTVTTLGGTYAIQESLHPNYWGQLANRNCLRQAYNAGSPRGGNCVRAANGLTSAGEPVMALR